MARIRTIKPEFPQSESVGRLSRDARLLFIQIWTVVDDFGRARAAPRLLAGQLYPYDDDATEMMPGWLSELERAGFIRLYQVDGSQYLDIPTWSKHQRIDNAGKSNIPEFRGDSPRTAASDGEPPLDLVPSTMDLGPRNKEEPSLRSAREIVQRETLNSDWPKDAFDEFYSAYPRKTARLDAKKAFEKVRKTHHVPWSELLAAVRAYAATADPQFTKHPSTWLNKGCWADENSPGGQNGHRGSGAVQNTGREILPAADKLIERIKSFDRPIPSAICSGEGAPVVRLLPEGGRERPGDVHGGGDGDPIGVSSGGDPARH